MLTMEITKLIEQCRQGDEDALGELYKAYARQMRDVCRRYISDEQTVEDVLHDAFVIIFTSFDRLRDADRAEAWMTAVTRNVASKCKEHQATLPTVSLDETSEAEIRSLATSGTEDLMATDNEEKNVRGVPLSEVVRMIDRLPDGYGQVFRLSVFEGMSHKEIADMLGIEPHSSSSQLARAKKMLRKMMRQYWVAVFLLLLMPLAFFLLKKSDTTVTDNGKSVVAKQTGSEDGHQSLPQESLQDQVPEPVIVHIPLRHKTVDTATQQPVIARAVGSVTVDSLFDVVAQERTITDTIAVDTTKMIYDVELPQYDMTLFPEKPVVTDNNDKKWSLELAYAGQYGELNHYNQPFSYSPMPSDAQSMPSYNPVSGNIDNWMDYAVYLAYNPDVVDAQTRSVIMRIALSNANRPGTDKMLRTSHHRMPVTWSLALKYRLNQCLGLESGLNYSRLTSDFEMGVCGNTIQKQQTIHYLGIPVKGVYNIYGRKQWGIYGSIGLTTEFPVRSTLNTDYYLGGKYEAGDQTAISAPWQFSTTLGLGLRFHLSPNVGFFAEPSLQYYIPMHSDVETYRTEHPFTFSFPLGIKFTW